MVIKVISFDLQGTLSDSSFSDELWLDFLPKLYAKSRNLSLDAAKVELKELFNEYGKYDYRYYSLHYWLKELNEVFSLNDIVGFLKNKPHFFDDSKKLLEWLQDDYVLIMLSSTTNEIISLELGESRKYFQKVYSSIDVFGIFGKPKELYKKIADELGVLPSEILHVGDSLEMDIINAKNAGLQVFFFDNSKERKILVHELREHIKLQK